MEKENKTCGGCKHHTQTYGNSVCNLYNKYTVAARIHCKMECWGEKPKEAVRVIGDKLIIK